MPCPWHIVFLGKWKENIFRIIEGKPNISRVIYFRCLSECSKSDVNILQNLVMDQENLWILGVLHCCNCWISFFFFTSWRCLYSNILLRHCLKNQTTYVWSSCCSAWKGLAHIPTPREQLIPQTTTPTWRPHQVAWLQPRQQCLLHRLISFRTSHPR